MRSALLLAYAGLAAALPQGNPTSPASSSITGSATTGVGGNAGSSVSSTSISTAIPSSTAAPGTRLQNYTLPEIQFWCNGRDIPGARLYCPGEILQTVQLAGLFPDSKTYVDRPTIASEDEVVNAFYSDVKPNGTVEALVDWIETYFGGEGLDIQPTELTDFIENPDFLNLVEDPILQGWLKIVHSYWNDLIRINVQNDSCSECVSSQIPQAASFIVPGGRFRENYYWDSYFAISGLLIGGLTTTTNNTIQNYLNSIENYGFIPNGGRIYYRNRSQPPLFIQMLYNYVQNTNDTSFLERAVELSDREMMWWDRNASINVTSPSGQTHYMHRYDVTNSAPRPESYLEDWETVNGNLGGPYLNLSTQLYSDIASGAESGIDYSLARWGTDPLAYPDDTTAGLRNLNVTGQIPVDLNAILYRNYVILSQYHARVGNESRSHYWSNRARDLREAIIDLHWDPEALMFRDFNLTANARADVWYLASYWPYFSGIIPDEVLSNQTSAQKAFSGLSYLTANYNGSIPVSLLETGQQWDSPNVWPPHIYVAVAALRSLPENITSGSFDSFAAESIAYDYLPANHFALAQSELPEQPLLGVESQNASVVRTFDEHGNLGNLTGLGWAEGLATAIANRYTSAAYCSWYATGGSIPGLVEQLSEADLQATNSVGNTGNMFEKFSQFDLDQAGQGGEYTVQSGFGWSNLSEFRYKAYVHRAKTILQGVAIWLGRNYGDRLVAPNCPAIEAESSNSGGSMSMHRNMELRPNLIKNLKKK